MPNAVSTTSKVLKAEGSSAYAYKSMAEKKRLAMKVDILGMDGDAIKTYGALEKYYWWFVGRRRVISCTLQKHFPAGGLQILDWGCGPGGNFSLLQKFGGVSGVDASAEAVESCRRLGITGVVRAETLEEFQTEKRFGLITAFDVLEHIPGDREFLTGLHRVLAPGGRVLVTVPAYQFLWSELDDVLHHVRRYTREELKQAFRQSGYDIIKSSYFISILSLPIILYRLLGRLTGRTKKPKFSFVEFPAPVNWLFTRLVYLEAWLTQYISLPFGTSIILLAKKRQ